MTLPEVNFNVPGAVSIDRVELGRIPQLAEQAATRLDIEELKRLLERVATIVGRHPKHLGIRGRAAAAQRTCRTLQARVMRQMGGLL